MQKKSKKNKKGFTLVEILITIGILGVLTAAVVVIINPSELIARSRDAKRIEDLDAIKDSIQFILTQNPDISFGTSSIVYVSIPDNASSSCGSLGLPALSTGYLYNCVSDINLRKVDGSGWIPIDFLNQSYIGSIPALPIDPINTTSTGAYYTYVYNSFTPASWELTALLESERNRAYVEDGGTSNVLFEEGTNLTLTPVEVEQRAGATPPEGGGEGEEPETTALVARMSTPPSSARRTLMNTLIQDLKTDGVWAKLDALWLMAAETQEQANLNWINNNNNISPVNTPVFTIDRGYQGNGSSSYLDTGFNPASDGSQYISDSSASFGIYSRTDSIAPSFDMGMSTYDFIEDWSIQTKIQIRGNSNYIVYTLAAIGNLSQINSDSRGFFVVKRSDSSTTALSINGGPFSSSASSWMREENINFYIGAGNFDGVAYSFSTRQYAGAFIGGALSDDEVAALNTRLEAYLDAIGAGVQ